jgi:hypothetical protein
MRILILLPIRSKLLYLRSCFLHRLPVDVSRIIEFLEIFQRQVVHLYSSGCAFILDSLVAFLFHLQHVLNICFQYLLLVITGSYNQIITYRLTVEYKLPGNCVADIPVWVLFVFVPLFPFGERQKFEII